MELLVQKRGPRILSDRKADRDHWRLGVGSSHWAANAGRQSLDGRPIPGTDRVEMTNRSGRSRLAIR
jgi:hypothetical protein